MCQTEMKLTESELGKKENEWGGRNAELYFLGLYLYLENAFVSVNWILSAINSTCDSYVWLRQMNS
jgi:hypothetical protein